MRIVSDAMTAAWLAEDKTGPNRPMIRATVARAVQRTFAYDTGDTPGGDPWHREGYLTSILFGVSDSPVEIPNIVSFEWNRATTQDVAEATLVLENTQVAAIGAPLSAEFDRPGLMAPNRGDTYGEDNPWGYTSHTGWYGLLVPDRMVKTFEGYGFDPTTTPAQDPNLMASGVWLIDSVDYGADGTITVKMRDIGRLLLDQIVFPPCVPISAYPLIWSRFGHATTPAHVAHGGTWSVLRGTCRSSNNLYVGKGITTSNGTAYVGANGVVQGHSAQDALSSVGTKYWVSTGQDTKSNMVWWEIEFDSPQQIAGFEVTPVDGPYRIWASFENSDGWIGRLKIPINSNDIFVSPYTEGVNLGTNISYFKQVGVGENEGSHQLMFKPLKNIKRMRLSFSQLQETTNDTKHPWRAGLNFVRIYKAKNFSDLSVTTVNKTVVTGNYNDWTDVIKWMVGWAGWWWPEHATGLDYWMVGPGVKKTLNQSIPDPLMPRGNLWGDFMATGTGGVPGGDIGIDQTDKQPFSDVISIVRDTLGFISFVDETGGYIWRMPNFWKPGNYITPDGDTPAARTRTTDVLTLDGAVNMTQYDTTLDSADLRDQVFVANSNGKFGSAVAGFVPYPESLRRIAGWTDSNFGSAKETTIAADMIVTQQKFGFRTSTATIPGNPAIQIDDQVKILERVTNETFHHYVSSISSSIDMKAGTWTYQLGTHWLGVDPAQGSWVVDANGLAVLTKAYLNFIGAL